MTETTQPRLLDLPGLLKSIVNWMRSSLAGNLLWLGAAGAAAWGMNFVTLAYTARALDKEAFGLLNFGLSIAAYATVLVCPGLNIWGVRAIAQDRQRAGRYLILVNLTQAALAVVAYLTLFLIASFFFDTAERQITLVAGLSLFAFAAGAQWVCQGLERFKLIGGAQVTTSAVTLLGVLVFVRFPADVYLIPLITAASQMLTAGMLFVFLHRSVAILFSKLEWCWVGAALRASVPLGMSTVMITILHYANNVILQFYRGSAELGLFSAGFRLVEVLTMVPGLITTIFLPRLSRMFNMDHPRVRQEMGWYVSLTMSLAFLPGVIFAVEAPELIRIIYGPQFAQAVDVLRVMGFAVVFNYAAVAYIMGLIAVGRDQAYLWSIFAAMVLSVIGGLLAVPRFGLGGATVTVASLDFATWLVTLPTHRKVFGSLFLSEWAQPIVAGTALAVWLLMAGGFGLPFWLRVPVGALLYLAIVIPWRALQPLLHLQAVT